MFTWRQRLKDRMVDWLGARRILQRPALAFPRGREVKVAIFPGTDALIDRANTIFQLALQLGKAVLNGLCQEC